MYYLIWNYGPETDCLCGDLKQITNMIKKINNSWDICTTKEEFNEEYKKRIKNTTNRVVQPTN